MYLLTKTWKTWFCVFPIEKYRLGRDDFFDLTAHPDPIESGISDFFH